MSKKELTSKSKRTVLKNYDQLLQDVRSILTKGLLKAYKAVDNLKVQTYWQIGERILREELVHKERADYGKRVIEKLATDLNFSRRLMFEIVQFYRTYPIVHALRAQLSWTHYRTLINLENDEERHFYEIQAVKNVWSTRELEKRVKNSEYIRAKKEKRLDFSLPPQLPSPEEVFKDAYRWDFLELEQPHSERELEKNLTEQITNVLLEFGYGFAFMGRQQKILITGQYHKVDLVFYHRFLKCVVLVDLKTEKFKREHVAQMNEYLTYFRENDKLEWERDPIGLIICKEKNKEEVHYALGKLKEDIFVAEYKTRLPNEQEIRKRLKELSK